MVVMPKECCHQKPRHPRHAFVSLQSILYLVDLLYKKSVIVFLVSQCTIIVTLSVDLSKLFPFSWQADRPVNIP
ncbi:hypothetical protein BDV35DRAFT_354122 [Aspergillus flavus]|uniref:Uncharacterized protein n=1 Tax=Aspergillus flavus TaxID=5059 RepID=A0A5N6GVQ2_ASPFL|nr:hypothetical protein BDV35DRAFT_354122 [Aspergillus flavus]